MESRLEHFRVMPGGGVQYFRSPVSGQGEEILVCADDICTKYLVAQERNAEIVNRTVAAAEEALGPGKINPVALERLRKFCTSDQIKYESKLRELVSDIYDLKQKISGLEQENDNLRRRNYEVRQEIDGSRKMSDDLEQENDDLRCRNNELRQANYELEQENDDLDRENGDLENEKEEFRILLRDNCGYDV